MLDIDLQLFKNEVYFIQALRDYEMSVRRAANGDIRDIIDQLIPGTSGAWKDRNSDVANHFVSMIDKIRDAITTGGLSWDYGDEQDAIDEELERVLRTRADMTGDIVTDIMVGGRFALFPYLSERTRVIEISVLSGWCYFVLNQSNSNIIDAVVQVTTVMETTRIQYVVRVYSDNLLEIYPAMDDWTKWPWSKPVQTYPLPYAKGLPVIPVIVRRGTDRIPKGLATDALTAFRRYLKDAITYNAAAEMYGRPETLVASDHYLMEAQSSPNSQLIKNLREKGPAALKIIGSEDRYENLPPIDLTALEKKQLTSLEDLASALKVPSVGYQNLSGTALQEMRTSFTQTVNSYANAIANGLRDALQLAAKIPGSKIPAKIDLSLKPQFSQDIEGERTSVVTAFDKGIIYRSQALLMLQQLGLTGITDASINDEMDVEAKDYETRLANGGQTADQVNQANGGADQAKQASGQQGKKPAKG